jgi:hypothetical protein
MADYQLHFSSFPSSGFFGTLFLCRCLTGSNDLKHMNNTFRFITGFMLGSVCGLAAGLLTAPTTGRQARKKLNKRSRKLAKKMAGLIGKEEKFHGTSARRKNGKTTVEA